MKLIESKLNPGVSIVICCHNSAKRLPPTLEHLRRQVVPAGIAWEVLVIDNASTDNTSGAALELWAGFAGAPLRVVAEPKIGLSNARMRGFAEAQFDLVSFVDDDNWVAEDWLQRVFEVMNAHPEVGACGGRSEAVFEVDPPEWFERHSSSFAVGKKRETSGEVMIENGNLWGAGLSLRKSIWEFLTQNGFSPTISDRKGNKLISGGDGEICLAVRLAGWKLWYDEKLVFKHFIPSNRMKWSYLRKIKYGFGFSNVWNMPYKLVINGSARELTQTHKHIWMMKLKSALFQFFSQREKIFRLIQLSEGDDKILELEWMLGTIEGYLLYGEKFDAQILRILNASWNLSNT